MNVEKYIPKDELGKHEGKPVIIHYYHEAAKNGCFNALVIFDEIIDLTDDYASFFFLENYYLYYKDYGDTWKAFTMDTNPDVKKYLEELGWKAPSLKE